MKLPVKIAWRYLFAKKSTNAINIISGICVFGIAIGTAALILVLSVFNGFEVLLTSLMSTFNPDIKIEPKEGKTFEVEAQILEQLRAIQGVAFVSETLEEVAFFEYKDRRDFGLLKGVDEYFRYTVDMDSSMREGEYILEDENISYCVLGGGLRSKLAVDVDDRFSALAVYMPKKQSSTGLSQPFRKQFAVPAGTFINQQDYESQYVLASLPFVRAIIGDKKGVSALEIKLSDPDYEQTVTEEIRKLLPDAFQIRNRYQQDEAFFKLMKVEKWMSFAILSLMLILVAFNMVGSLWMIVLEKKQDIAILQSMGLHKISIRNVFLTEGVLLSMIGISGGFFLAIVLYLIQVNVGIISFPGGFAFDAYPISLEFTDFVIVFITVITIGILASILPARRAMIIPSIIREEI